MVKIEKSTIIIKNKEYAFLKPTAVDLIEIEDKCICIDGTIDTALYDELMLGLVSKDIKKSDLIEYIPQTVELSDGNELSIPEVPYDKWLASMESMESFSRIRLAKNALIATGASGEITFTGFQYADIDKLAMAYFGMYDASELRRVVDELNTFCF
ncbi:MAG: hypothetical protein ACRCX2_12690 [Paraclostridium sp.]